MSRVVFSQLAFHLLQEFRPEFLAAQDPSPLERLALTLVGFLPPSLFHPAFKLLAPDDPRDS
jgi:hypothetical protein